MAKKLADVLEQSGISINFQAGGKAPDRVTEREVDREPGPRAKKLRDLYFQTLSSATNEFPYWYTRKYKELEGEIPVVRRAKIRLTPPQSNFRLRLQAVGASP